MRIDPARSRPLRAWPWWGAGALLFYSVCTCVYFWPVLAHAWDAFPEDLGDPPMQAWIIGWDTHILLSAPTHLWDANVFFPAHDVLAYQDNLLGLAPVAMPLLLLSGNLPFTYNVLFLLSFILCGWCAYLFIRYLLVASGCAIHHAAPAAVLGGLVYTFLPFKMSHLGHLNLLSAEWLPLIFLCWERGFARRPAGVWPWIGLAVTLILEALCSLHYAVYAVLALAALLVMRLLRRKEGLPIPWRPLVLTTLGTAVALLPILIPYVSTERALGAQRSLSEVVALSPDLRDVLHTTPQSLLYGWTDRLFPPHTYFAPQYLFPGLSVLILAIVGARTLRRRSTTAAPLAAGETSSNFGDRRAARMLLWPYVLVGISAAVLSLGPFLRLGGRALPIPLPYLLLYEVVPAFQGLRDPARFMILAGLCLGLLAARGAVIVVSQLERAGSRYAIMMARRAIWPALWALVLLEYAVGPVPMPRVSVGAQIPAVYRWLARQPPSIPVLELPIGLANRTIWSQQSLMMYYSTYHWHTIVNGVPGFVPPWYYPLLPTWQEFPSTASLRVLHGWGVRYVIVHTAWTGAAAARQIAIRASDLHIPVVARFGTDIVYGL